MLSVVRLRKHFGPGPSSGTGLGSEPASTSEAVLDEVSFELRAGERVALVGPNGAGKTTLLRILAGEEDADAGSVQLASGVRFGFLRQHLAMDAERTVWEEGRLAFAEALGWAEEAERVAAAMAESNDESERRRLGQRFDLLQQRLHHQDAYQIDHKIERVLEGLGFMRSTFGQRVEHLSGGQRNRLVLAKLLLEQPDILLLDEPSNHLDIEATQWLEDYLVNSNATLLVVSHDRFLLDKVATRTLELFRGRIDSFAGNYSAYRRQKEERVEVERRTYERQRIEIGKLEEFIRRNHYGQKSAQAEDRRKKLERIERVAPPRAIAAPAMGFPPATRTGDIVLRVERLAKSFASPLFQNVTFDILRGEKWGILGPNGIGKTTLLRCLLGRLEPDAGHVSQGAGVRIGYFDQQLEFDDESAMVMDAVRPPHKEFIERERRDVLARFGITGDMAYQPVRSLSGGERNRVALARLAALDANVLVLDEPTNHLDLWARDALEQCLRSFEGTVVFVSHDRYFVNQAADHLLVLEPDRAWVVEGDYDTYLRIRAGAEPREEALDRGPRPTGRNAAREAGGTARPKRRFPYRKVGDLEAEIADVESRIVQLHEQLTSPDVLRDGTRVKQVKGELDETERALARLYEHWEEAIELNN
ncbi:MAG: ABC-F family ATP-binding cassette domain-containing protein [Planctomycetes bacterium]|nr:ABC-F family ATP-binding cassette domain-containing protein [Planctomycetota bacterium]